MDILFIGGLFPKDEEAEISKKSKGAIQAAANVLQWNIVKGLDSNNSKPLTLLNAVFVGSYPKYYTDLFVKSRSWNHTMGSHDLSVGFLNLFFVKRFSRTFSLTREACKWAERSRNQKRAIVIYSMNTAFLAAASAAKKNDPSIHVCLICPDLPEFMNPGKADNRFYRCMKRGSSFLTSYYLKTVDSFVFLTKYMYERINVKDRPWITVEGMIDDEDINEYGVKETNTDGSKVVLYTGGLNKAYGIIDLVEAFGIIDDPSINLWLCGKGDAEKEVIRASELDTRIKYFGQVTRSKSLDLQHRANLLINPRNDTSEFTKYSFPSKLMEYMLSGTPVLVYKLPGIPDEYFRHLFFIEGKGPQAIANSITKILNEPLDAIIKKGEDARSFVLSEKNNIIQTKKILDLIHMKK